MRETFAKCFVAMGVGLAVMGVEGCKKQATPAPVQPVVRSAPRVQPDFPVGSLPVENVDPGAVPRANRTARVRPQVQPVPAQSTDAQAASLAAEQRQQDARLLQEQQAASQKQQQELNQQIEQEMKRRQEVDAEPRIQDNPGPSQSTQPQTSKPQR